MVRFDVRLKRNQLRLFFEGATASKGQQMFLHWWPAQTAVICCR